MSGVAGEPTATSLDVILDHVVVREGFDELVLVGPLSRLISGVGRPPWLRSDEVRIAVASGSAPSIGSVVTLTLFAPVGQNVSTAPGRTTEYWKDHPAGGTVHP